MNKKLKLDPDALTVISFTSSVVLNGGGTVHGHSGYDCTTECTASGATHCNSAVVDCADTGRSCYGTCELITHLCMER